MSNKHVDCCIRELWQILNELDQIIVCSSISMENIFFIPFIDIPVYILIFNDFICGIFITLL